MIFAWVVMVSVVSSAQKQGQSVETVGIAFYNLENLFDTIPNNPENRDEEYTPAGKRAWDSRKYNNKIHNLAYAISQMKSTSTPFGPAIIGVAEVENRGVLDDLVADRQIASWNLQVVHHDSPDSRGIDVGLLYNPKYFEVENVTNHTLTAIDFRTRDQMCVVGRLMGQKIAVIVNHWPSRLGGQKESSPHREAAAALCKEISDSLWRIDPSTGVMIMGDLNDDPMDKSTAVVLGAKRDRKKVKDHGFFNPWWKILDGGVGTLEYKGQWNLFDQIIISGNLLDSPKGRWRYLRAEVLNLDFLKDPESKGQPYPLRTYSRGAYRNGYSDHFPTEIFLIRK